MAKPKRVHLGELRYPAQSTPITDDESENHRSCTAWSYAKLELEYLYDLLIDLISGYAARERSAATLSIPEWPLPTESELRDCLHKTFVQDCALQQATRQLSYPYRRNHSPGTVIAVRNTVYKGIRGKLDKGVSPDLTKHAFGLFRIVGGRPAHSLPKTAEEYGRDIEIAANIEEELYRKDRSGLKPEIHRISNLVKNSPLSIDDWDQFLWSDFLDRVFTHSTRYTIEITTADLGPNKPAPRQKSDAPIVLDSQILRRMRRQTSRTLSHQIGHAFFTDDVIDDFLQNVKP